MKEMRLPAEKLRVRVGDMVWFRGWVDGDETLAATVCKLIGTTANLCVYTASGGTTNAHQVPLDARGGTPGSWRPRD